MPVGYTVVVLAGDQAALLRELAGLGEEFASMSFEAYRVADRGFVVFGWHEGTHDLVAIQGIEDLAEALSLEFGKAVAAYYDKTCDSREATLYQNGEAIRSFGEEDELWAPTDDEGHEIPGAPRRAPKDVPEDEDYVFVWDGIDAALEAAGFRSWLTDDDLTHVGGPEKLIWERAAREEPKP